MIERKRLICRAETTIAVFVMNGRSAVMIDCGPQTIRYRLGRRPDAAGGRRRVFLGDYILELPKELRQDVNEQTEELLRRLAAVEEHDSTVDDYETKRDGE